MFAIKAIWLISAYCQTYIVISLIDLSGGGSGLTLPLVPSPPNFHSTPTGLVKKYIAAPFGFTINRVLIVRVVDQSRKTRLSRATNHGSRWQTEAHTWSLLEVRNISREEYNFFLTADALQMPDSLASSTLYWGWEAIIITTRHSPYQHTRNFLIEFWVLFGHTKLSDSEKNMHFWIYSARDILKRN